MVIGKIKPVATIVAQFAAGVEVECIQHDGKLFLPVMNLGDFASSDEKGEGIKPSSPTPKKSAPESKETESDGKTYSEDELMDMDPKELTKILKNDLGINPDDHAGKNTNKKLRKLILDAQASGSDNDSSDSEDEEDKKSKEKSSKKKPAKETDDSETSSEVPDDLADTVADVLEQFDNGKKNKKKSLEKLMEYAANDSVDSDSVSEALTDFENNSDASIEEVAEVIAKILSGEKPKKDKKSKEKSSKKKPATPKGEEVEIDDLEKGDHISVYFDDEEVKGWYEGTVSSVKKGKVHVDFDDDTEDDLDEEIHTKIIRLEE